MKPAKGKRTRAIAREAKRSARLAARANLKVDVTFRHVEPTDALRQYATKRFSHVARVLKRPCDAHLILTVDKYRQSGEVIFKAGSFTATAAEEAVDLYAVIDLLTDKVGRQLKKHAEKLQTRKMRASSTPEVLAQAEDRG